MNPGKGFRKAISDKELKRRWSETKKLMKKHDIDCVITQGSNMHLGGYVRWFTDIPAESNLFMTVIFPADGEMTLVRSSASPIPEWALRGVKKVSYAPFVPTLNYTSPAETKLVVDALKEMKVKRLGWIGKAMFTTRMMDALHEQLKGVEFVDITNDFDMIKALKSDEELDFIRETARVHDAAWSALPAIIKPGMMEYQIRSEIIRLCSDLGSEEHLVFMGTAPPHKPCGMSTFQYANRKVNDGDYGTILIEVSGPGGYYCESARNFSFGKPYPELQKAWDVAVEAQQLTADMLEVGRPAKDIVATYNKFVGKRGYSQEGRLYGHSQGYDLVERPAFMAKHPFGEEDMILQANMNISMHPYFIDDVQTVYVNDNFFLTDKGVEKIHKTPAEIIIL